MKVHVGGVKFLESVKIHVRGVKVGVKIHAVGVKVHVISVKFLECVNFLES